MRAAWRDEVNVTEPIDWEPQARERLAKVPFFMRPLVRRRAEQAARERGMKSVTSALLGELKSGQHAKDTPGD